MPTFTLTLIKDEENSRILVVQGETPAKADDEAEAIASEKALPNTYKTIVDAIPNFREAEDGCEDWVTHTPEEFQDIYDLDLLKVFSDAEEEAIDSEGSDDESETDEPTEIDILSFDAPEFDSEFFTAVDDKTNPTDIFKLSFGPEHLQSNQGGFSF